jgi:hypothetical protein
VRIEVDIGGTFTDVVVFDEERHAVTLAKVLTTPAALAQGVQEGLVKAAVSLSAASFLSHGSTVVVNAILERRGAKTALVTTQGFRDVYEIGRINRPESFNLRFCKHRPLVPHEIVFEVPGRMLADGTEIIPLDTAAARTVSQMLHEAGSEAVAVVLLHSYRAPAHEVHMCEILHNTDASFFVTASHELSREYRSGPTAGRSACEVAFTCLTTPLVLPINEGAFRPLTIVLPPGRVVSATRPAALCWWMTTPQTVVDTIFKALAPACPERVIAGHHADLASGGAYGYIDPETGRIFAGAYGSAGLAGGGWGAKLGEDGMNATVCINNGNTHNSPVEACEAKAPLLVVQRALRQDSGDAGKWRGGLGVTQAVRGLTPAMFDSRVERTLWPPWACRVVRQPCRTACMWSARMAPSSVFPPARSTRCAWMRETATPSKRLAAVASATRSDGQPSRCCGMSLRVMSRLRLPDATTGW